MLVRRNLYLMMLVFAFALPALAQTSASRPQHSQTRPTPPAETPADERPAPRTKAPSMSNEGIAIGRAATTYARKGNKTLLNLTVVRNGQKKEYVLTPEDCLFETNVYSYDFSGRAKRLFAEVKCMDVKDTPSVRLTFGVNSEGMGLQPGLYSQAYWSFSKVAPEMDVVLGGLTWAERAKRNYEIYAADFDFSSPRETSGRVLNFGV